MLASQGQPRELDMIGFAVITGSLILRLTFSSRIELEEDGLTADTAWVLFVCHGSC